MGTKAWPELQSLRGRCKRTSHQPQGKSNTSHVQGAGRTPVAGGGQKGHRPGWPHGPEGDREVWGWREEGGERGAMGSSRAAGLSPGGHSNSGAFIPPREKVLSRRHQRARPGVGHRLRCRLCPLASPRAARQGAQKQVCAPGHAEAPSSSASPPLQNLHVSEEAQAEKQTLLPALMSPFVPSPRAPLPLGSDNRTA